MHASQSPQQPHAQHRVLRQPHKQTKDYHRTTNTTQTHRPSSKSERNLIILQVNINGLRNKLEELKLLIHDTHADIITIQETKLTPKAKTPKIHNFTSVRTDRLHKAGSLHSLETTSQTYLRLLIQIQNPFLTAQSTQIKSVISVPIKDFIHHYPRALFNDIPRVGTHFYNIPGLGRTFTHNTAYSTSRTYHTQSSPEM